MEVFLYRVIKLIVSGNVSECRDPVRGEKRPTFFFYKCTQKCVISIARGTRNTSIENMARCSFTLHSNFSAAICSELERRRLNRPARGQPALTWNDDKVYFACSSGGDGPILQSLSALGLHASSSKNQAVHDFATKLLLLSRMLGSV